MIVVAVIVLFRQGSESEELNIFLYIVSFIFLLVPVFFVVTYLAGLVFFVYEFIVGESILSKLRKRVGNPAKQKGLLTKIGKWLS